MSLRTSATVPDGKQLKSIRYIKNKVEKCSACSMVEKCSTCSATSQFLGQDDARNFKLKMNSGNYCQARSLSVAPMNVNELDFFIATVDMTYDLDPVQSLIYWSCENLDHSCSFEWIPPI